MSEPRDFKGTNWTEVTLAGRTYRVGGFTIRNRADVSAAIKQLPHPEPVAVDVKGLMDSMHLTGTNEALHEVLVGLPETMIRFHLQQVRRDVTACAEQMARDARAMAEMWPPDPMDELGVRLIQNEPAVTEAFFCTVLTRFPQTVDGPDGQVEERRLSRQECLEMLPDLEIKEFRELLFATGLLVHIAPQTEDVPKNGDSGGERPTITLENPEIVTTSSSDR